MAVSKAKSRTSGTLDAHVAKAKPKLNRAKLTASSDFDGFQTRFIKYVGQVDISYLPDCNEKITNI